MSLNVQQTILNCLVDLDSEHTKEKNATLPQIATDLEYNNRTNHQIIFEIPVQKPKELTDTKGKTALFLAVEKGDFIKTKTLLDQGFNPNTLAHDGRSMLAIAMEYFNKTLGKEKINHSGKQYSLIELLLKYEANPKIGFDKEGNAFDFSLIMQNCTLLKIVSTYHPDYQFSRKILKLFLANCSADELKVLINLYPTIIEPRNYTLIHHCVKDDKMELLEVFLNECPDFFKKAVQFRSTADRNKKVQTPLEIALFSSRDCSPPRLKLASFLAAHGGTLENLGDFETYQLRHELFSKIFFYKIDFDRAYPKLIFSLVSISQKFLAARLRQRILLVVFHGLSNPVLHIVLIFLFTKNYLILQSHIHYFLNKWLKWHHLVAPNNLRLSIDLEGQKKLFYMKSLKSISPRGIEITKILPKNKFQATSTMHFKNISAAAF